MSRTVTDIIGDAQSSVCVSVYHGVACRQLCNCHFCCDAGEKWLMKKLDSLWQIYQLDRHLSVWVTYFLAKNIWNASFFLTKDIWICHPGFGIFSVCWHFKVVNSLTEKITSKPYDDINTTLFRAAVDHHLYYLHQGGCVFNPVCLYVSRITDKYCLIFMKLGKSVEWPSEENPLNFDGHAIYVLFVLLLCRISRIQLRGQPSTESSKLDGEWWEVGPLAKLANRVANLRMKCYCFTKDGYIRAGRCRKAGFCAYSDETASNSHLQLFIHPCYRAMERNEDCGVTWSPHF